MPVRSGGASVGVPDGVAAAVGFVLVPTLARSGKSTTVAYAGILKTSFMYDCQRNAGQVPPVTFVVLPLAAGQVTEL